AGHRDDPVMTVEMLALALIIEEMVHAKMDHQNLNDVFDFNPTAENIAKWICDTVPHCVKVTVQESEGNVATYEL
ncbi:6-carboxytetrahydropterin synthase, partial [Megasphaera sp. CLA-AA-H81]